MVIKQRIFYWRRNERVTKIPNVKLANGILMPQFGLGVYKVEEGKEVEEVVDQAIQLGYRLIDTARFYDNEEGVGRAIKKSAVPREELFITTKVWNDDHGYEETITAFKKSLKKLDLDYIDLYLIHWPIPKKYKETWRALEYLYEQGLVKAIGVSNFHEHHLEELKKDAKIIPMVNQIELHPQLAQQPLRAYCQNNHIQVEAWAPIARGKLSNEPGLLSLSEKYQKTVTQIILRWHIQNEIVVIPKTTKLERLKENRAIFDFALSDDDMRSLNEYNIDMRMGKNPDDL